MIGIYRIYNLINGKSYIGQSKDLFKRFDEHICHRNCKNSSEIDKDIGQYGINNFAFQILEICDFSDLDWKEAYYIKYFKTDIYGYNIITGGQNNIGESNSNHKIKEHDVYYIRELYNNHYDPNYVYINFYKNKISFNQFFNIWEGKSWPYVHMDVYTEENKNFYKNMINTNKEKTNFSDEEIIKYRNKYINETAEEVYNSEKIQCKFNTFKSILTGNTYKHLPIYSKKNKCWINI